MTKIDYRDVLSALVDEKVPFVLVGGFAAVVHGVVRVTMDLDIAIALNSRALESCWDVLTKLGFQLRQPIPRKSFSDPDYLIELEKTKNMKAVSFYHSNQPYLIVDILFGKEFSFSDKDIVEIELFGVLCPVVSKEKLIELKKIAGRAKDLEDAHALEEL